MTIINIARKLLQEYFDKSKKEENIKMMEKYFNKINELKKLKNITITKNQIDSYNKEISLLKEKQKFLYDDFIINYNNQKEDIDFKYKNKIDLINDKNKKEKSNLNNDKKIINKNNKNKKILILERNIGIYLKLNLYLKAKEAQEEIKKEKNKLINNVSSEQKKRIRLNKIKIRKNKLKQKILMNYQKEKNDLQIKFNKEKNELLNKFKSQLIQCKEVHIKNQKYEKIKYLYNQNNNDKLNKSFNARILNKKIEDDESSISFNL